MLLGDALEGQEIRIGPQSAGSLTGIETAKPAGPDSPNGYHCKVCGDELTGKQRKFCSLTCTREAPDRPRTGGT